MYNSNKYNIDKKFLYDRYIIHKLGQHIIAKEIKCNPATIWYYLNKFNIPIRKIKRNDITKKELIKLYINKKMSMSDIKYIYNVSSATIFKKMKKFNIKSRDKAEESRKSTSGLNNWKWNYKLNSVCLNCGISYRKRTINNSNFCSKNCYDVNRKSKYDDLIGKKFGYLIVLIDSEKRTKNNRLIWKCKCECGGMAYITSDNLKHQKSCGCLRKRKGKDNPSYKNGKPKCLDCQKQLSRYNGIRCENCNKKYSIKENGNNWNQNLTNEHREKGRISLKRLPWILSVYERDNYTCQKCRNNKNRDLNAHHILNYSDNKKYRWNINNGITFCQNCHKEFHKKYTCFNNTKEQLQEYLIN